MKKNGIVKDYQSKILALELLIEDELIPQKAAARYSMAEESEKEYNLNLISCELKVAKLKIDIYTQFLKDLEELETPLFDAVQYIKKRYPESSYIDQIYISGSGWMKCPPSISVISKKNLHTIFEVLNVTKIAVLLSVTSGNVAYFSKKELGY